MILDSLRRPAARALENGAWRSPLAEALASLWARRARAARPVVLPEGARVIGVGGPTLGGSHKTPLALALARDLARAGVGVAVAAHGYRSSAGSPRRVLPTDAARSVGDDAAWLARALHVDQVPVFVGAARAPTLAAAAERAAVVVADGLLQASPVQVALSLLVVDADTPWGAGRCPPVGDLRAPRAALVSAADALVAVTSEHAAHPGTLAELEEGGRAAGKSLYVVRSLSSVKSGAEDRAVPWDELSGLRVGVVLAVARPNRVTTELAGYGIRPVALRFHADHAVPRERRHHGVDVWLTTEKCATKLGRTYGGAPLFVVERHLALPPELVERAAGRSPSRPAKPGRDGNI